VIVQLTDSDIEALVAVLSLTGAGTAAVIRWAKTPTKERLIKVENQVSEIYGFLIKQE